MQYCEKCGTALNEEGFCPNCGAPTAEKPAVSKDMIVKIGVAVAALAVIIIALVSIFSLGGPKAKAKAYAKALIKGDAEKIVSMMPKKYVEYAVEEYYDDDKDELIEMYENRCEYFQEWLEDEEEIDLKKAKIKVTKVKDLSEKKVKDLNENYEDADIEIKAAKEVKLEFSYKKEKAKDTFTVVKVGGKWCILG